MNRRIFLLGCTALAGCQNPPNIDAIVVQVTDEVTAMAGSLTTALNALVNSNSIPQLTPSLMFTVTTAINGVQSVAAALKSVTTQAAAQPLIAKLESYINAVVNALVPISVVLPPPVPQIVTAVSVALPFVEGLLNMAISNPAPTAKARAAAPAMDLGTARLILRQYAH